MAPLEQLSLSDLIRKAATLALYSFRRVRDLSLLDICRGPLRLVLQVKFGAKQDRPGHKSTPITNTRCQCPDICTLTTLCSCLDKTVDLRGPKDAPRGRAIMTRVLQPL